MPTAISITDLRYQYPDTPRPALENISFEVEEGEFLGITGPTGSGKSSLCLAMNSLIPNSTGGSISGSVEVFGLDMTEATLQEAFSANDEMGLRVGMTFQDPDAQIVGMSVEEDLAFGPQNFGLDPEDIDLRIDRMLGIVRMSEYRDASPHMLSGGQKQRVAIAAAMIMQPKILVLDEPTSELDPIGRNEVYEAVQELRGSERITVVMVDHHTEELARYVDRVVVLDGGRQLAFGPAAQVLSDTGLLDSAGVRTPSVVLLHHLLHGAGYVGEEMTLKEEKLINGARRRL